MRALSVVRSWTRRSLTGLAGIAALVVVALSPFILQLGYSGSRMDWGRLSDIGETYGAISALLSGGALVILGISLALQAREIRHAREQAARNTQFELMRMMLDEPAYQEVLGGRMRDGLTVDEVRRDIYLNLLLNWWQMRWEFGDMPEIEVREAARMDLFSAPAGRDYWRRRGTARMSYANSRRGRRFNEIFDEEYREASLRDSWERATRRRRADSALSRRRAGMVAALVGTGLTAGALSYRLMARSRNVR